jgi:hypothetical protein
VGKNYTQKLKKVKKCNLLKYWMFSLRAGGFSCYLDVLYEGLRKNTIHCNFLSKKYEIFSIFQNWFSNPWIQVQNLIWNSIEKQIQIHNTGFLMCRWFRFAQLAKGKKSRP